MTKLKLPDPEPCQLIIFPLSAQIGKVRHVTDKYLAQPNANAKQRYWNTICRNLWKLLEKQGCDEVSRKLHLTVFRTSVQQEIDRRQKRTARKDGPTDPKGAA